MTESTIKPAYKKHIGYHGALLGAFAALAAFLLVAGNISTREDIKLRMAEDLQGSLSQVIPAAIHDNRLLDNKLIIQHKNRNVLVYQATTKAHDNKTTEITAVAFSVSGQGYAGEISLIMGVNNKGEVLGVRILSHAETPGLGDKIEVEKDDWIYSFDNLSFKKLAREKWKVKKDGGEFDQFSGATITPRGVVKAVKEGLIMFSQHQHELLTVNTPTGDKKSDHVKGEDHEQ